jgi:hypothetical protein
MVRAAGWLLVAALAAGCATDKSVEGTSHIGKVQAVYVEQYAGVFVDRQAAGDDADKVVWVYVTFDRPLADGRRFATAILEQDTGVQTGDLVQLRFARDGDLQRDAQPARNQVIALIAKHDTAAARAFASTHAATVDALRQAAVSDTRP